MYPISSVITSPLFNRLVSITEKLVFQAVNYRDESKNWNWKINLIDNDEIVNVKYIQNRAVIFHSKRLHKSHLNFGKNINDGRLTLNSFIEFEK